MNILGEAQIAAAFTLLGERLAGESLGPFRLVICGGAGLISMSLVSRATRDVDIVALMTETNTLISPDPIPRDLARMARIVVDQGAGKHLTDLLHLDPTDPELEQAARWAVTHDTSVGFHTTLKEMFMKIGRGDVAGRI